MYNNPKLVKVLLDGGLVVMPTDTIYGIVARSLDKSAVKRLMKIRRGNDNKPFIILISQLEDLKLFSIDESRYLNSTNNYWPGPVSIIFPCNNKDLDYLHLGTNSLAFRLPKSSHLRKLLSKTGPLVAPSANLPGKEPAEDATAARWYFGEKVDYYLDCGEVTGSPSKIVSLLQNKETVIRG